MRCVTVSMINGGSMRPFFKDADFNYSIESAVYHQAADVGEVLSTVERIRDGDARSWVRERTATADRLAAERIKIPYEGTALPGYFFRPAERDGHGPRRTLIFNNGSDGPVTAAWVQGIADALARGWNAMTFDGPGQNAALVRQRLPFRPDWENVTAPVVDYLLARPDVDGVKVALLGTSQAGYWVPRALAFEHRVAAAVADPGVIDVSTVMLGQVPHFMAKLLDAGEREKFDRDMELSLKFTPSTRVLKPERPGPGARHPSGDARDQRSGRLARAPVQGAGRRLHALVRGRDLPSGHRAPR